MLGLLTVIGFCADFFSCVSFDAD